MKRILIIVICLGLVGCATLDRAEVLKGDKFYIIEELSDIDLPADRYWRYNGLFNMKSERDLEVFRIQLLLRVGKYIMRSPDLDKRIKDSLLELKIRVGMSREEVELLWGKPHHVMDKTPESEKWVYVYYGGELNPLFEELLYRLNFTEGKLDKIERLFKSEFSDEFQADRI